MLPSFRPQRRIFHPYVCWRCLAKLHTKPRAAGTWPSPANVNGCKSIPLKALPSFRSLRSATSAARDSVPDASGPFPYPTPTTDIRQRLRQWEIDNAASYAPLPMMKEDTGDLRDAITNPRNEREPKELEGNKKDGDDGHAPVFERDELVDVGARRKFLLPGDLVELRFVGGAYQELAIFIRELESQGQYYTMSGKWVHRTMDEPKFYVPGFVQPHELEEIKLYLPHSNVAKDLVDKLQQFRQSLPRNIGKDLLKKMNDFWVQADTTYLIAASKLEVAHQHLADQNRMKYATLDQMANVLLDPFISKIPDGGYSQSDLYAVHRAVLRNEIGFRVQPKGTLRTGGSYEILSLSEVAEVALVRNHVRSYTDEEIRPYAPNSKGSMGRSVATLRKFLLKCQRLIDRSRKHRNFTPYGGIGPSSTTSDDGKHYRNGSIEDSFTPADELYIRFIESWASFGNFNRGAAIHGTASAILRATHRYDDALLVQKTGWTFLQEIGVIPPWETQSAYELRLPYTGRRLCQEVSDQSQTYIQDQLASLRRDWKELPIFCIDQVGASEIDDGVSVEITEIPDEFWVHIHVADPASHLAPKGGMMENARLMMQNVYHPDRTVFMLDPEFVETKLSLAPGRPCLTFSSRLNSRGQLLEHKISPGVAQNVIYTSPSVFDAVASGDNDSIDIDDGTVRVVGSDSTLEPPPDRVMSTVSQLSDEQREQLKLLHALGTARRRHFLSRGGLDYGATEFDISAHFHGAAWQQPATGKSVLHHGDPTIKLVTPETKIRSSNVLAYLMMLAGETCARWCSARGVPIPYRVTPSNPGKPDPVDYFYKVLLPSRNTEGIAPLDIQSTYLDLIGPAQPSLTPGPHLAVGAEILTKCTSPLRRFPDLLVHTQIVATLLEEERLGKSLVGNTNEAFLPYSAADVNDLLPQIDARERSMKKAQRDAKRQWLSQFLMRAWRFNEAELPPTLTFIARATHQNQKTMSGVIEELSANATCRIPDTIKFEEIMPNDSFEVEITDVDLYLGRIEVTALRRLLSNDNTQE